MSQEMKRSVLIVETRNPAYFDLAKRGFNPQNIAKLARSHPESIRLLSEGRVNYGALVFDLDAFGTTTQIREALKEARYYGGDIPIIARTEPQDRTKLELDPIGSISVLNAGADNILPKTAHENLLPAYITALRRRQEIDKNGLVPTEPINLNGFIIDILKKEVLGLDGQPIHLYPIELRLLAYLLGHRGEVMPHQRILADLWGPEYADDIQLLRGHVSGLRENVKGVVITRPGFGYIIEEDKSKKDQKSLE